MQRGTNGEASGNDDQPRLVFVTLFTAIACLGSFLTGINNGYSTQTLSDLNSTNGTASISSSNEGEIGAFNAMYPLGALFGGLFAGWASDVFGRKRAILIGNVPQLIGWILISVAHRTPGHKGFLAVILLGRFIAGLGVGWNSLCVPVYITEISPVNKRGFFGAWNQLFGTFGILAVTCLGIDNVLHYYYISIVAIVIMTAYMIAIFAVEESPVWLLSRGRLEEAEKVLRNLRGSRVNVNTEIDYITASNRRQREKTSLIQSIAQLKRRSVMIPFLLSLMLMFFQQFSGVNALMNNAVEQLKRASVTNSSLVASLTIGGTQVVFTVVGILLVEWLGRQVLLVTSSVGIAASCILLAVNFCLVDTNASSASIDISLAVISFVVFFAAFSVGWGPLPWVMMSELVPTSVRGVSTSAATAVNWFLNAFVTFIFKYYEDGVKPYGALFTFGGIMILSIPVVVFIVPETKGRTTEEIQQTFEFSSYREYLCSKRRSAENDLLLPAGVSKDTNEA